MNSYLTKVFIGTSIYIRYTGMSMKREKYTWVKRHENKVRVHVVLCPITLFTITV